MFFDFLPFCWNNIVDNKNPIVVLLCVVHNRIYARADAFASFVFVALCLMKNKNNEMLQIRKIAKSSSNSRLFASRDEHKRALAVQWPCETYCGCFTVPETLEFEENNLFVKVLRVEKMAHVNESSRGTLRG